ncbi:uncharacterized protein N7515_001382 [Penicillium bovifimosum]|uniref:Uncharacterized protein n=1 Tax=Penicillium bovifimosum TaxID=126998 RepID=A0A9W9H9K8_9EURO|nr:uncharacterized protein N7515_001382 [Penicillium bovifimosum]KAJ5142595.1 hypothetical protein N7515_001382 [Penicillium bovifimosum]
MPLSYTRRYMIMLDLSPQLDNIEYSLIQTCSTASEAQEVFMVLTCNSAEVTMANGDEGRHLIGRPVKR